MTEANYSNGDYYHYAYDAVGNRETQTTLIGGLPSTTNYVYDDANRLSSVNGVNYTWDNNGNLLNDGVNTYTYDSANRLKTFSSQSTVSSYQYSGLGDRLRETVNGNPTTFTMDLNSGLTQALSDGTNTYIYGLDRIAQVTGMSTEYFLSDALGSVRQMTNASGAITYAKAYDPYGVVTTANGASSTAYGYTGEFTSNNLVYLRARMYAPGMGRFLTRDTWMGEYNRPLSLNRWMYVEGNPVNHTDPSGKFPIECQSMPNKAFYELCILTSYGLEPLDYSDLGNTIQGERGCYSGPYDYRAPGYLEGEGGWLLFIRAGYEVVYDFATMERENFSYIGVGINDALDLGGGYSPAYVGRVKGFRTDDDLANQYRAFSGSITVGASADLFIGVGGGGGNFWSWTDFRLRGNIAYVGYSLSADFLEGVDLDFSPALFYQPDTWTRESYILPDGSVRKGDLMNDILSGKGSIIHLLSGVISPIRHIAANSALKYANAYEELRNEESR